MKKLFELSEEDIRPKIELNYNREILYYQDLSLFQKKFKKKYTKVDCVSCLSKSHSKIFEKDGFDFRKCDECETVFISPRPESKALEWWYTCSEQVKHSAKILEKTEANRMPIYKNRIDNIFKRISHPVDSVLEIGCSNGNLLSLLQKIKPELKCTGIDMSPDALKMAEKKEVRCINISAEEYAEKSKEKYDLILAFEILEHVYDPLALVNALKELLNKDGVIYMTMPNYIAYDFLQVGDVYRNIIAPSHLNYFNPSSVIRLLARGGYQNIKVFCDGILDTNIVNNYHSDKKKVLNGFWGYIYNHSEKYSNFLVNFQKLLQKHKLSGNMTVLAQKTN